MTVKEAIYDLCVLGGTAATVYGLSLWSVALAAVVGGLVMAAFGVLGTARLKSDKGGNQE